MNARQSVFLRKALFSSSDNLKTLKAAKDAVLSRSYVGNNNNTCIQNGLERFQSIVKQFGLKVNENLIILSELFARQCNAIVIQRARRTAQVFDLYSRIYSEQSKNTLLERLRNNFFKRTKGKPLYVLFGASVFNWEREKVSDEELASCVNDMDHIVQLLEKTENNNTHYMDRWEVVIDRSHLKAWRRPITDTHLYQYKVYGSFSDVSARAFYNVQVDLEYRKEWDKLVIKLDRLDKEEESGSEVVHWVTHYPYPMYSRDYVFVRRAKVDKENNIMVLSAKAVKHPSAPVSDGYVRVTTYNSKMVIRPHGNMDENGFDYVLTYYDDPQAAFPTFAYNWMASTGVPEFVDKLHHAAMVLQDRGRQWRTVTETGPSSYHNKNYQSVPQYS